MQRILDEMPHDSDIEDMPANDSPGWPFYHTILLVLFDVRSCASVSLSFACTRILLSRSVATLPRNEQAHKLSSSLPQRAKVRPPGWLN